jgi:hypothetical protein
MIGYASTLQDDRGRTLLYPESPYYDNPDYSELQESYANQGIGAPNPYYQAGPGSTNQYPTQVWGR